MNTEKALWLIIAIIVYVNLCLFIYSMSHPHMTQTEVWHNAWQAVTWDW